MSYASSYRTYPNQFGKYIGAASGATLGYIGGNTPGLALGATIGWRAGKQYSGDSRDVVTDWTANSSRKNKMSRSRSVSRGRTRAVKKTKFSSSATKFSRSRSKGSSIFRSSSSHAKNQSKEDKLGPIKATTIKKTGKAKNRLTKRPKSAKISKKLVNTIKNVVNSVNEEQKNTSTFHKEWLGDLSPMSFTSIEPITVGWGWFFSHLHTNTNAASSATSLTARTTEANRFLPITTKKLYDAASVLFNLRTAPLDYTQVLTDGGGRVNGFINEDKTRIDLVYASAQWEIRNLTEQIYEVVEYIITNKQNSDSDFMSVWKQMNDEFSVTTSSTSNSLTELRQAQTSTSATATLPGGSYFYMAANKVMEPRMYTGLKKLYSWQRKEIRLEPGQSIKRFFPYTRKFIDFNVARNENGDIATFAKGEQQVIYRFSPVLAHTWTGVSDKGPSIYNVQGGFNAARALDVHRKETYRMFPYDNAADKDQKTIFKCDYGDSIISDTGMQIDPTTYVETSTTNT